MASAWLKPACLFAAMLLGGSGFQPKAPVFFGLFGKAVPPAS